VSRHLSEAVVNVPISHEIYILRGVRLQGVTRRTVDNPKVFIYQKQTPQVIVVYVRPVAHCKGLCCISHLISRVLLWL